MHASLFRLPSVSVEETLSLRPGIVDLWYYFYEAVDDEELLAAHQSLMTLDEHDRHRRLIFEKDRLLFLATRALVRTVLSNYAAVRPDDWRFVAGRHGKPRIASPATTTPIHFNLANTRGVVVCAVSVAHQALGVDAERIDREVETNGIADRFFCPSEVDAIGALPAVEQPRSFFAHWTLKESYLKARGHGLALPLDQFSFRIDDAIRICFHETLDEDPTQWQFALLDAPPHLMAVGVETGGLPMSLRARQVVPLAE